MGKIGFRCFFFFAFGPVLAAEITVQLCPLTRTAACANGFVAHELDHIMAPRGNQVRGFDSLGAGLAVNDLNNDGYLDIVLANLQNPNAIFWNEGHLTFRKETFPNNGAVRAALEGRSDYLSTRLPCSTRWWPRRCRWIISGI